jgi:hypothetical protein
VQVLNLSENTAKREDYARILLTQPVCTQEVRAPREPRVIMSANMCVACMSDQGEKIALSRRVDKHWRLIGWGTIRRGTVIDIVA